MRHSSVEEGELVQLQIVDTEGNFHWIDCRVVDPLSIQFTAEDVEGNILYRFYADEDDTWRKV